MADYNDPFEQVGESPTFDWNAAAKRAKAGRKPPTPTPTEAQDAPDEES